MLTKKQKAEQAEEVNDEANLIVEDEADDLNIDLDSDSDSEFQEEDCQYDGHELYDQPLDDVDEVLNLGSHLQNLKQVDQAFYDFLMQTISG